MKILTEIIKKQAGYREMLDGIKRKKTPVSLNGVSSVHKALVCAALCEDTGKRILYIVENEAKCREAVNDINTALGYEVAVFYPFRDFALQGADSVSREYEQIRISALIKYVCEKTRVIVTTVSAAMQYTVPPQNLKQSIVSLRPSVHIAVSELAKKLCAAGYVSRPMVDGVGEFSIRGGIVDVFPPSYERPFRIEYWGEDIDTISTFDIETQRREDTVRELLITPSREVVCTDKTGLAEKLGRLKENVTGKNSDLVRSSIEADKEAILSLGDTAPLDKFIELIYNPSSLFDYFDGELMLLSETNSIKNEATGFELRGQEEAQALFEAGVLYRGIGQYGIEYENVLTFLRHGQTAIMNTFVTTVLGLDVRTTATITASQSTGYTGDFSSLCVEIEELVNKNNCVLVLTPSEKNLNTLRNDLENAGFDSSLLGDDSVPVPKKVFTAFATLSGSVDFTESGFSVIFLSKGGRENTKYRRKRTKNEKPFDIGEVEPGDYVVHIAHGIGIFEGIRTMEIHGVTKDYISIRYAERDMLYVPVTQLDLVSKYVGNSGAGEIKLNKLNSSSWMNTCRRVKAAVREMAQELTALYAKRMQSKGYQFSEDNDWQNQFEDRFEWVETDDQLRCVEEVKADMESTAPMDRLLCGDVGFGKTEVALRAAFKCILDSKQVALLVPTTILAWQHFGTVTSRMEPFPVKVEMLSRFRTKKEQEKILRELARGEIDMIIGTHRLLQDDVKFKDLGLVIIDEEQRFGVAHKEKLKKLFLGVDVLMLSATPIPRTLNMAMSKIRDMSVIEEAPQNRYPVQTFVIEHNDAVVCDALRKELRRGGQAYYLHNRVDTIELCAIRLSRELPDARIGVAHGKMTEQELSKIWKQLIDHEIDVLVCTTIIETGVDVSNCNTLIIENADCMGLSQLYQLRGRIGRSSRRAYAYLTFRRGKEISEIAEKRLSAIREFTAFGSGFKIAMRDLEIRGAGNVLGASQHGHMESVGYDMYIRMLNDAIAEEKGEAVNSIDSECLVDLNVDAFIPNEYIENTASRVEIYRKIAMIRNEEDSEDVIDELIDRYGEPPSQVIGLIDVAMVRNLATQAKIKEISQSDEMIMLYSDEIDRDVLRRLIGTMRGKVFVNAGSKPYIGVTAPKDKKLLTNLKNVLLTMLDNDIEEKQ